MSTRSLIAIENPDKSISAIYCHSDGYPSYVGFILHTFWNNEFKVRNLIGLGFLSKLGVRQGTSCDFNKFNFDTNYRDKFYWQCIAYCRDRGENWEVIQANSKEELYKKSFGYAYLYIFRNNEWYIKDGSKKLQKLVNVLIKDENLLKPTTQGYFLTDSRLLEEEKTRFLESLEQLGILKFNKKEIQNNISDADYIVEQQFDSNTFSVRCTVNNSRLCMKRAEIKALIQEGCKVEIRKGSFIKL